MIILNLELTFKETHCFGKKAKNGAKTIIGGDVIRKEMTERERERERWHCFTFRTSYIHCDVTHSKMDNDRKIDTKGENNE